jgi:hypothetical protein
VDHDESAAIVFNTGIQGDDMGVVEIDTQA